NSISMPREMTMLGKGLITIEGVAANISPEINVMSLAVDYAKRRVLSHKTGKQDMLEQLESLYMLFSTGAKIPAKLLEFVNSALAGRLKVKMDYSHQDEIFERLNRMVNRIVFSLILASLIIGSSLILFSNAGPKLHGVSLVGLAGYAGAAVIGFWLLISIIRSNRL
ncbi:MAG: AarF/ABC1/UbiB kinase family protein, partial [Clostridia bacterium]|nr:AarF/ABC1/UbiB kinase family protein [Clostridia bacterium]